MSATGVSASTSSSVFYRSGSTPTPCRRKSSMPPAAPTVRRDGTPHFYIPGESVTGVFPSQRNAADVADANRKSSGSSIWTLLQNRVWNLVQTTLKKDPKLSEMDVFNEACAMRLAAQFRATRSRGRRELDQLTGSTEFTREELKLLYWGWKCSCLSGSLTEATFKEIYAQFFPQAGDSSLYAHHVYRAMFSEKAAADVNFTDYAKALSTLCRGSTQDKLLWTFKLYDINNDEKITLDEVEEIARAIYALLGYYVSPPYDGKTSDDRARQLFSKLDPHNKSFVTKEDFIQVCSRDERIVRSLELLDTKTLC